MKNLNIKGFFKFIKKFLKQKNFLGFFYAITATAFWSGNFIIARILNDSISPINLAFIRWMVAIILFLPFGLKLIINEWGILKKNIPYLSITSMLGITILNPLVYYASYTTTAMNLSLIAITFPIFIIILSRFLFDDLITINKSLGIILVIFGLIFLITKGNFSKITNISFAKGDVWMLLVAICFAIYSILLKKKPKHLSIWALQFSTFILGIIFLFPLFIWGIMTSQPFEFNLEIALSVIYLGIFASLFAFILWNKAIDAIGPSKTGIIYYTLPIFSGFLSHIFLEEKINNFHFYSMILIISGVLVANYESKNS